METFKKYLERHEACRPAIKYASSLGFDVTAVVENCPQADWLMWVVTREPKTFGLRTYELTEYGLKAAQIVAPLNTNPRFMDCVYLTRKYLEDPTPENRDTAKAAILDVQAWEWVAEAAAWERRGADQQAAWAVHATLAAAWKETAEEPDYRNILRNLVKPLKPIIVKYFSNS